METRVAPTFRPLTDDDDLGVLTDPDPFGWVAASWRELDKAQPLMLSWLAEVAGRPVGYAMAIPWPLAAGGYGVAHGWVDTSWRQRGIGGELHRRVCEGLRGRVPGVQYTRDETDDDTSAAACAWGLTEAAHHTESILELSGVDEMTVPTSAGAAADVQFRMLDLAMSEEEWHALHTFVSTRFLEAPDTDADAQFAPLAVFRRALTKPWSLMTAERDGVRIGVTLVTTRVGTEDAVNTWFTGVTPDARRQGVATALKRHQAAAMAAAGIARVHTQNMDGNEPILRANARLGYTASLRYVDLRERLPEASSIS